jgi:hypothetical protein
MAGPQSYPSPTRAETQAGAPFYHTSNPSAADSVVPTTEVPDVSMDQGREDINVSQLERLHNEIVAQIHPDLENSASKVALAAASSAADAAASIAASDAHQQLARQVMSLGGVDVAAEAEAGAHTPPFQMGEEGAMTGGGGASGVMTGSAKVRSKVSRACDECRRKKVRCIFVDSVLFPPYTFPFFVSSDLPFLTPFLSASLLVAFKRTHTCTARFHPLTSPDPLRRYRGDRICFLQLVHEEQPQLPILPLATEAWSE